MKIGIFVEALFSTTLEVCDLLLYNTIIIEDDILLIPLFVPPNFK